MIYPIGGILNLVIHNFLCAPVCDIHFLQRLTHSDVCVCAWVGAALTWVVGAAPCSGLALHCRDFKYFGQRDEKADMMH